MTNGCMKHNFNYGAFFFFMKHNNKQLCNNIDREI